MHSGAIAGRAEAAGCGGEHLGAIVPGDSAEVAGDRQPVVDVRAGNLGGYGL